jgi:hypothetical protein
MRPRNNPEWFTYCGLMAGLIAIRLQSNINPMRERPIESAASWCIQHSHINGGQGHRDISLESV